MSKIVVVGAGAWGTALAMHALRAGCSVDLVARNAAAVARISEKRESPNLPGVEIPKEIAVHLHIDRRATLLLWAIPMQQLRASLTHYRPEGQPIIVCAKGLEAHSRLLPLEVIDEMAEDTKGAVLSGPNFAHEVAAGLPAAAVIGAADRDLRRIAREVLGSPTFRLYGSDDVVGVQLGGAAKNVIAIAAGAVMGAGLGENARAALVTRGLSEISRLATAMGGHPATAMGLSALGDLMLSCSGPSSRNFRLGFAIGETTSVAQACKQVPVTTEGVATAGALVARAAGIELPICQAVADLLDGSKTLEEAIEGLLSRPQRDEE
jgi:glycerol-3-phosphate dehydrogenase (NAD(P)+)